jgi:uncharacterized protein YcfL
MRKTLTAFAVILALSLCGCAATQQEALEAEAGITAEADTVASYSSSEPVSSESSAFVTTAEESRDESETSLYSRGCGRIRARAGKDYAA